MKVAALQMVSGVALQPNLEVARQLLQQAARAGAELAVLPEYFCAMGRRDEDKLALRERLGDGPVQRFLADAARELGLWIVGGTLPLAGDDPRRVYNSSLAFSPAGECVARYDKIHLFRFDNGREQFDEARTIQAGQGSVRFALPARDGRLWHVGLSVCYDLRFASLYRRLSDAGANILLIPAAFTVPTGKAHWETLLRARAIESACFVIAAAQVGSHEDGRETYGHSLVIDPWGEILLDMGDKAGLGFADIDFGRVEEVRARVPVLTHRRILPERVSVS